MRVNLDFAKLVYSFFIVTDPDIPGCTVRNTSIPEELGRITYLLSDKTGTLTQNGMPMLSILALLVRRDCVDSDLGRYDLS